MNIYKEFIKIMIEISLSIFFIIFGYAVWDNFDNTNAMIAKNNNNTMEVETNIENNTIYIHNVSKKNNTILLKIKVDKSNINKTITIDDITYIISEDTIKTNGEYNYIEIKNIDLKKYETKEFKITNNNLELFEIII